MTMVLAGLGGVLIAPLFQLQDYVFTFVVLGSLAAVVLGGLRSIPIAFAGGLLLGVVQNLVAGYSDDFLPKFLSRPQRPPVGGAVPPRHRAAAWSSAATGRARAGSVADDVPPPDHREGLSKLAPPAAVGDLDRRPRSRSRCSGSTWAGCRPTPTTRP